VTARAPEMANPPDAQRARYLARKEAGICVRSKEHGPAEPGHVLCAPCIVDSRYDRRESYRRNRRVTIAKGCARCGGDEDGHNARSCENEPLPGWPGRTSARVARDKAKRIARKNAGLCIVNQSHAKPSAGRSRCDYCMSRRNKAKR
jgi:hypothetical protein